MHALRALLDMIAYGDPPLLNPFGVHINERILVMVCWTRVIGGRGPLLGGDNKESLTSNRRLRREADKREGNTETPPTPIARVRGDFRGVLILRGAGCTEILILFRAICEAS